MAYRIAACQLVKLTNSHGGREFAPLLGSSFQCVEMLCSQASCRLGRGGGKGVKGVQPAELRVCMNAAGCISGVEAGWHVARRLLP